MGAVETRATSRWFQKAGVYCVSVVCLFVSRFVSVCVCGLMSVQGRYVRGRYVKGRYVQGHGRMRAWKVEGNAVVVCAR